MTSRLSELLALGLLGLVTLWPQGAAAEPPVEDHRETGGTPKLPSPGAEELYRLGKEALAARRYKQSIGFLRQAAASHPGDAELSYWLGVAHWKREEGQRAIGAYRLAVEADPNQTSEWSLYALENLAEVYTRTDHAEEARETYRRALARETRPEWIHRIHNQIGELDLALGEYRPDDATLYNDRGEIIGGVGPGRMHTNRNFEIARQTNDPGKEEKYYRNAIDTDARMYQPYFNLGLALVHQGRYREAVPWLEESDRVWKADSAMNPGHIDKTDAQAFLALCHLELGDVEMADHHAQRAQATGEADYWAVLHASRVQIALGRAGAVLPTLETLAADNPEHAETLYALSRAYAALEQVEKSREALRAAFDAVPEDHPWMAFLRDKWRGLLDL